MGRHARLAAGDRRPDRLASHGARRSRARTRPATRPTRSRRSSSRRATSARSSATAGSGRTRSTRSSATRRSKARSAPTRCRATRRASTCRRSSAAPTSRSRHEQEQGARGRLDHGVHEHRDDDALATAGGVIPNTTSLAQDQRGKPHARPVRRGGEVELVRPDGDELGERRERERAAEHAHAILTQPGSRCRARQKASEQITKILNASVSLDRRRVDSSRASSPPPSSRPPGRLGGGVGRRPRRARGARRRTRCSSPAAAVIAAVLGYPLYFLGALSFQHYGLFELIRHQGTWVGLDNYATILARPPVLDGAAADGRVHGRQRRR